MIKRGDVYIVDLGVPVGHRQGGVRPAVIVSNNEGNAVSPTVVVVPLTSKVKRDDLPMHILLSSEETGLKYDSIALSEQIVTVDMSQVRNWVTRIPDRLIHMVGEAASRNIMVAVGA